MTQNFIRPKSQDIQSKLKLALTWHFLIFYLSLILHGRMLNKVLLFAFLVFLLVAHLGELIHIFSAAFKRSGLLLLEIWGGLSLFWSFVPFTTFVIVSNQILTFIFCMLSAYFYANNNQLARNLKVSAFYVIVISFLYVVFFYDDSTSALGLKSLFRHKNHLGFAMSISILSILFAPKLRWLDGIFVAIGFVLLILSQSKTSLWLALSIILMLFLAKAIRRLYLDGSKYLQQFLDLTTGFVTIILYLAIMLMVVYSETVAHFLISHLPYNLLTGRGEIWVAVLSRAKDDLLTGIGPGVFWGAGQLSESLQVNLWIQVLKSADGGYIDVIGALGFIGLGLLFVSFTQSYHLLFRNFDHENSPLVFVLLTFFIIHNITETNAYQTGNTLWFLYVFLNFYLIFIHMKKVKIQVKESKTYNIRKTVSNKYVNEENKRTAS